MFVLGIYVYFSVAFPGAFFDPVLWDNRRSPARLSHEGADVPEGPINTQTARAVRGIHAPIECFHRLNEQQAQERSEPDLVLLAERLWRWVRRNNAMDVSIINCRTRHLVAVGINPVQRVVADVGVKI